MNNDKFCTQCGFRNDQSNGFCAKCGNRLAGTIQNQQSEQMQQNASVSEVNTGGLSQSYVDKAVNPDVRIWLVLSIVIPTVAIVWYFFIGLSVYIALIIAGVGFACADKGKMANPKLAIVGKVLNGILIAIAVVMFILILVTSKR